MHATRWQRKRGANMVKDIIGGLVIVAIVVFMWSWASNIAPRFFLRTVSIEEVVECQDCPFNDLARCQICIDIHDEYYNEAQD